MKHNEKARSLARSLSLCVYFPFKKTVVFSELRVYRYTISGFLIILLVSPIAIPNLYWFVLWEFFIVAAAVAVVAFVVVSHDAHTQTHSHNCMCVFCYETEPREQCCRVCAAISDGKLFPYVSYLFFWDLFFSHGVGASVVAVALNSATAAASSFRFFPLACVSSFFTNWLWHAHKL